MRIITIIVLILGIVILLCISRNVTKNVISEGFSDKQTLHFIPNFISDEDCNTIIQLAENEMTRSDVMCKHGKTCISDYRTSSNTFLKDSDNPVVEKITQKIESIMGINREKFEDLQVVKYNLTQEYKEHYDACVGEEDVCKEFLLNGGQRYATIIIYLNDDFEGGETYFPNLKQKVKPKKGNAVLFFGLKNDNITPRLESLHAGLTVTKGIKYICNKWIRVEKFV